MIGPATRAMQVVFGNETEFAYSYAASQVVALFVQRVLFVGLELCAKVDWHGSQIFAQRLVLLHFDRTARGKTP